MRASTIDDVVTLLDGIIARSITQHDRRGYFAALYNRVTRRVRAGIRAGEFEDNPRMERLDVLFANRYFEAFDAFEDGGRPTRPWALTFEAARGHGLMVVQHLLLGMVTHITFDLGIASAQTAPGRRLEGMHRDFLAINQLLAEETVIVERELVEITEAWSPPIGRILELFEGAAHGLERSAAGLLIDAARDRAWELAVRLNQASPAHEAAIIEHQERESTALVDLILLGSPAVEVLGGGSQDVATNIEVLARDQLP